MAKKITKPKRTTNKPGLQNSKSTRAKKGSIGSTVRGTAGDIHKRDLKTIDVLTKLLTNKNGVKTKMGRKTILSAIKNISQGKSFTAIADSIAKSTGIVISEIQAKEMLETQLKYETEQAKNSSDERVKLAAIEKGFNPYSSNTTGSSNKWNDGISNAEKPAGQPGQTGTQSSNTIGSFLGG